MLSREYNELRQEEIERAMMQIFAALQVRFASSRITKENKSLGKRQDTQDTNPMDESPLTHPLAHMEEEGFIQRNTNGRYHLTILGTMKYIELLTRYNILRREDDYEKGGGI